MKLLCVALLLITFQPTLPQESGKIEEQQKIENHGKNDQRPADSRSGVQKTKAVTPDSHNAYGEEQNSTRIVQIINGEAVEKRSINWTAIFDGLLVFVGAVQAWILCYTRKILKQQISVPQRAFLALGEQERPLGNEVRFSIENYGHVAAKITSVEAKIIVLDVSGRKETYHGKTKAAKNTVAPGKANIISISFGLPSSTSSQTTRTIIEGTIHYDDGFNNSDRTPFYRYRDGEGRWVAASKPIRVEPGEPTIEDTQDQEAN
jgi:hypothetical protein